MPATASESSIRCGVFDTVEAADRAVSALLDAGFRKDQISVLCSDATKERHFRRFEHEEPSGTRTPEAAATGGAIGAILGGLMSAGVTTAAGLSLLVAGPSFLIGGAVIGGLIGAMQTRRKEKSLADFYDQSLTDGKLLVGVEDKDAGNTTRLAKAEEVFREAGVEPLSLERDD